MTESAHRRYVCIGFLAGAALVCALWAALT
jgi:hypothetical protein